MQTGSDATIDGQGRPPLSDSRESEKGEEQRGRNISETDSEKRKVERESCEPSKLTDTHQYISKVQRVFSPWKTTLKLSTKAA